MLKPSYQALEDAVLGNAATGSAAEAHGMLVGMLCMNRGVDFEQWLSEAFADGRDGLGDADLATLRELYDETRRLLDAVDFSFRLLLPDDDAPLSERASALSGWCQGFLFGIGSAGAGRDWSADCAEVLRDLTDISQLDANAAGEEDEAAFAEVSEFVRVGVQIVRGELQESTLANRHLH